MKVLSIRKQGTCRHTRRSTRHGTFSLAGLWPPEIDRVPGTGAAGPTAFGLACPRDAGCPACQALI